MRAPTRCTSHREGAIYGGDRTPRQLPAAPAGESLHFNSLLVLRVCRVMPKRIAVRSNWEIPAAGRGRYTALPLFIPGVHAMSAVGADADVHTWTHERQSQ